MKIVLVGAIGNHNFGDDAILQATLSNIEKVAGYTTEVYILTRDCSYVSTNCLKSRLKIIPLDYIFRFISGVAINTTALEQVRSEIINCELPENQSDMGKLHNLFSSIDVLHVIGGGFINSLWVDAIYEVLIPVELANRYHKRIILTGQTIGPIYTEHERLLIDLVSKVDVVDLRDDSSYELIMSNAQRVSITCDDAITYLMHKRVIPFSKYKKYINVCIQNWASLTNEQLNTFLDNVAEYLNGLLTRRYDINVNLWEFSQWDMDIEMADRILNRLLIEHRDRCSIISKDQYTLSKSLSILRGALFNIGTRFHLTVFSLVSAVPVFSIYIDKYYEIKIKGIHSLFSSDSYCSIHNLSCKRLDEFEKEIKIIHTKLHHCRSFINRIYHRKMLLISEIYRDTEKTK